MASSDEPAAASSHPGTSGRSPPPPRGGGRPSIGGASSTAGAGLPSLDGLRPGRLSSGSALHGTRLSYGGSVAGGSGLPPPLPTPATRSVGGHGVMSPPSTTSTGDDDQGQQQQRQGEFFAALSPATAQFLRGKESAGGDGGGGGTGLAVPASPASKAAAAAVRTAANAARGIDDDGDSPMKDNGNHNDNGNDNGNGGHNGATSSPDDETAKLRSFVQSLLGIRLPLSTSHSVPILTTPDPVTASFYATSLLTQTASIVNGQTKWRPDDAYLAARACSLTGEGKRAVWILDRAGLIGFGMGAGEHAAGALGEGDAGGGMAEGAGQTNGIAHCAGSNGVVPAVSNEEGMRNALLLRAESALLAGQCLIQAGEHERALAVYEEAMRFPPPPPPAEWGRYGYGYRMDGFQPNDGGEGAQDGEGLEAKLADEMYLRAWREQSLSHAALIDDGDDERLLRLASHLRPLPLSDSAPTPLTAAAAEGIHPVARLCAARGKAYDAISNPHRAVPFLRAALTIDARCVEAWDYVVTRRLLTPEEEREWMASMDFGGAEGLGGMGIGWLKDAYLARLRGGAGSAALPPTALEGQTGTEAGTNVTLGASPVPRSDLQSPSMLSIGSPDFAGGAADGAGDGPADMPDPFAAKSTGATQTIDEAFRSLSLRHNLGRSPDVLSHAAMRAYAAHDLRSALAYCTALDAIDPYCRTAGYVHVATLVGLNLKRRLFHLAHRLVDTDPKDALAWFAVGSYYYACRRYDLAQRHFSRSTRLDPGCAECWIGFGCSFAVCDESDQALASFRAAQNKHPGGHVPLLYMGIEYLRTNHLSLAGHFLTSAQKVDPSDVLCCNELGVWSYRQGDMEDASFWFMKALRLHVRAELSALTSTDEALGMDGYILLNGTGGERRGGTQQDTSAFNADTCTPYAKRRSNEGEGPPLSTVLCAVMTPSGQEIAASIFQEDTDTGMTDTECIERCKDQFWEPTIFNLGQSYRKMKRYDEAIVCFEKCSSLNPGNYAAYAALGFAKHLGGDVDGAIDSYHEALSRKPEDPFTSEMLTRALAEAVTYPPSLAMLSSLPAGQEGRSGGVGSSILKKMGGGIRPAVHSGVTDQDTSNDVDMSLA